MCKVAGVAYPLQVEHVRSMAAWRPIDGESACLLSLLH
jgi:hypothetical protein